MSLIGFLKKNKQNILIFLIVFCILFFMNRKFKMIEGLAQQSLTPEQKAALSKADLSLLTRKPKPKTVKLFSDMKIK
jgi:hypothetical protein